MFTFARYPSKNPESYDTCLMEYTSRKGVMDMYTRNVFCLHNDRTANVSILCVLENNILLFALELYILLKPFKVCLPGVSLCNMVCE